MLTLTERHDENVKWFGTGLFTMLILDFNKICRLCLTKGEKMVPIFNDSKRTGPNISSRIENCTCLKLKESDGLPGALCTECLSKLDLIKAFQDQCERSDIVLREFLKNKDAKQIQSLQKLSKGSEMNNGEEFVKSVEQIGQNLLDTSMQIPVQNISQVPIHNLSQISVQNLTQIQNLVQIPVQNLVQIPIQNFVLSPVENLVASPLQDFTQSSVDGLIQSPGQDLSVQDFVQVPVQDLFQSPLQDLQSSVQTYVPGDVQNYVQSPVQNQISLQNCGDLSNELQWNECLTSETNITVTKSLNQETVPTKKQLKTSSKIPSKNKPSLTVKSVKSDEDEGEDDYTWPGSLSDEDSSRPNGDSACNKRRKKQSISYECEYCGRTFSRSNHLMQHELTHTKEKPFHCSYCGKGFWYKNSLIGHIKQTHTGDVNYTCEECGRGFFQRSEYMRHKPIHSSETPFKCDECDMSFKLIKNLRRHQKVHSGTRTHTCQYCGKSFRMRQTLRVHLILHSGEKPYKCEHCGRGFSQSAPLKAHVRMHTGEKPYVCKMCGESFQTGNSLKAHVFKHTGIHPNSCKECSLVFKRKKDLVEHRNNVHDGAETDLVQVTPQIPLLRCKSDRNKQVHSLQNTDSNESDDDPDDPDSLSEDSQSSDSITQHEVVKHRLPPIVELSSPVSSRLMSPPLIGSPSETDELISSTSLSYA